MSRAAERRRAARRSAPRDPGTARATSVAHVGRPCPPRRAAAGGARRRAGSRRPARSDRAAPSLSSTVTMLDCRIAGSLAQPSTLTMLAANGPPSCSASPRGTTNSANSMMTAIRARRRWRRRAGSRCDRLQVQRAQQVAIDQLERRRPARASASRSRFASPSACSQPVAPVVAAARRAHAAAAVVVQDDVVAARTSPRRGTTWQREQPIAVRDDVEDVAVQEELRGRSGAEQVAHLGAPRRGSSGHGRSVMRLDWLLRSRAASSAPSSGGGSVSRSSIAP